jgi:hypothetical protein
VQYLPFTFQVPDIILFGSEKARWMREQRKGKMARDPSYLREVYSVNSFSRRIICFVIQDCLISLYDSCTKWSLSVRFVAMKGFSVGPAAIGKDIGFRLADKAIKRKDYLAMILVKWCLMAGRLHLQKKRRG